MQFRKPKSQQASAWQDPMNVPLRVSGFAQGEKGVGVVGTNPKTGEELTIFLTDKGKMAENPNRKSIQDLQEGFAIGRNRFKLEPGGLVAFKGAFQPKGMDYMIAPWADVLAYNENDLKNYVGHSDSALLRMSTNSETGRTRGSLYVFEADAAKHITDDVKNQVAAHADQPNKSAFLIRVVDEDGVVAYDMTAKRYNTEEGRPMSPDEIGDHVVAAAEDLLASNPGTSVNIVPANVLDVSPKWLADSSAAVTGIAKGYAHEDEEGHVEAVAKETYFKLGGQNNEFVNAIVPTDPYGPGHDPVLLGDLKFSPRFGLENNADTAHAAASQPQEEAAEADYDSGPSM